MRMRLVNHIWILDLWQKLTMSTESGLEPKETEEAERSRATGAALPEDVQYDFFSQPDPNTLDFFSSFTRISQLMNQ